MVYVRRTLVLDYTIVAMMQVNVACLDNTLLPLAAVTVCIQVWHLFNWPFTIQGFGRHPIESLMHCSGWPTAVRFDCACYSSSQSMKIRVWHLFILPLTMQSLGRLTADIIVCDFQGCLRVAPFVMHCSGWVTAVRFHRACVSSS